MPDEREVFITGDCHGDAGINYWLDERDKKLKSKLTMFPITFLCG